MKNKIIKTEYREVTVRKLPLGDYAEFFKHLLKLSKYFQSSDDLNEEQVLSKLPSILQESPEIAIGIITLASDLSEKEATSNIGLDDALSIFEGILEVNNYSKIADRVKKMIQKTQRK